MASSRGLLAQLRASRSWSDAPLVDAWALAGAAAGAAAGGMACLVALETGIAAAAYARDAAGLTVFDRRNGYTAAEAAAVLRAWGPRGRLAYLAIEAVDTFVYLVAYRAAALVLLNRARGALAAASPPWLRAAMRMFARAPLLVAALDTAENVGQSALTLAYHVSGGGVARAPWWRALVAASSAANVAKWLAARILAPPMAVVCIAGAATALRSKKKQ